jgi:hypothetical protein
MPFVFNNQTNGNIGSPISYSWSIDGSPFSNQRLPPPQVFNDPGIYKVTLGVSSEQCPLPVQTLTKTLKVENPAAAVRYPIGFALRDVPLLVEARGIGVSARWNPAVQLSDPGIYQPVFKGITDREYTITLKTEGGCLTVDTLLVLVAPKADIQVPTAFTPNGDGLNDFLYADMQLVLPNDMLTKVDLMSMANSLEVRVPFLDHEVVDFLFSLPSAYKIDSKRRKKILVDTYKDELPEEIFTRAKHGFEVPLLKWFKNELRSLIDDDLLSKSFINTQGFFDYAAIEKIKLQLYSNNPGDAVAKTWALIVFQYWYKKHVV